MALTTSYLTSTKNFEGIMNSIIGARAPSRFTTRFLEDLGYKSSGDRLVIGVLKSIGLLGESGEPTQRYYDFLDQTKSKKLVAIGVQEAYEDLFNLCKDAQNLPQEEVKNKLRTLTQGQKGDKVVESMARTFKVLCDYADWSEINYVPQQEAIEPSSSTNVEIHAPIHDEKQSVTQKPNQLGLHYNIQIHLPETTNMAVYDAIFQSLKKHLL